MTYPVLVDDQGVGYRWEIDGYIPSYTLLGPAGEILAVDQAAIDPETIEAALPL